MKPTRMLLTLAAGASLLGSAGLAADSTTPPARPQRAGPPPAEMQAWHEQVMAIYDTDKNGVLDETERAVLKDDIDAGTMQPPPAPPAGRGHRMGPPPEILAKYDTDKDGVLSAAERAALEADITAGKLPAPPPPPAAHPPKGDGMASTTTNTSS